MEPLFIAWWMVGMPQYKNYGFLTGVDETPGGNLLQISLDIGGLKSMWIMEHDIVFEYHDELIPEETIANEWGRV